jgi:uncharacterized Ntn-hydrolase superfamily protein
MTWSIVARDRSGLIGVAVASRFFAVGALCAHGRGGVGALSTQALVNPRYAAPALDAMAQGRAPAAIIAELTLADPGRDHRQLHLMDARGESARYTGRACIGWCGDRPGEDYSLAGNMLVGPEVLEASALAFERDADLPFARRLMAALVAGESAGGDKRGKQAAALRLHGDDDYARLDLRVDDHAEPIDELRRLYDKSFERFQPFIACLASSRDPVGLLHRDEIEARIEASLQARASTPTVPSAALPEVPRP